MKVGDLRGLELHEKRWISILMGYRMMVIDGMAEFGVIEREIAERTGLKRRKIHEIIQANHNLSLADIAKLQVCFGELRREAVSDQINAEGVKK